jgi:hypothetical protein
MAEFALDRFRNQNMLDRWGAAFSGTSFPGEYLQVFDLKNLISSFIEGFSFFNFVM